MTARAIVLAGFVVGLAVETAAAPSADEPTLRIGDRVRITAGAPAASDWTGTLVAADDVALILATKGRDEGRLKVARSEIATLEVARGRKSMWLAGAATGACIGLLATGLACADGTGCSNGDAAVIGALLGGSAAAVGALVGAMLHTDRWHAVPTEKIRVGVSPLPGRGVAITMQVGF